MTTSGKGADPAVPLQVRNSPPRPHGLQDIKVAADRRAADRNEWRSYIEFAAIIDSYRLSAGSFDVTELTLVSRAADTSE